MFNSLSAKIDHFVTKNCFSQFFQCPQHYLIFMKTSIYPSVDFLSKYLTMSSEEMIFMDTEDIYFFHCEERYKK